MDTARDALQGAGDILAEEISDRPTCASICGSWPSAGGCWCPRARPAEPEDTVYRLYYDFRCPVSRLHGHQILAMERGSGRRF